MRTIVRDNIDIVPLFSGWAVQRKWMYEVDTSLELVRVGSCSKVKSSSYIINVNSLSILCNNTNSHFHS
jgi:hypothetical protein